MDMHQDLMVLWEQLIELRSTFHAETWKRYKRINPFVEDLFDWGEKGNRFSHDGATTTVYDSTTIIGDVTIGSHSWIGPFCSLDGTGGLEIGKYCSVAAGTRMMSHDSVRWALSGGKAPYEYDSIKIGDQCFIGVNSVITKGVELGSQCIVAAGSVVTRSFEALSIVAGSPARKVGLIHTDGDAVEFKYFDAPIGPP